MRLALLLAATTLAAGCSAGSDRSVLHEGITGARLEMSS